MRVAMSKQEWFAAHAPSDIPTWFVPVMPPRPIVRALAFNVFSRYAGTDEERIEGALFHKFYDVENEEWFDQEGEVPEAFKEKVNEWSRLYNAEYNALQQWKRDYDIQRYFQWRKYYAKKMADTFAESANQETFKAAVYFANNPTVAHYPQVYQIEIPDFRDKPERREELRKEIQQTYNNLDNEYSCQVHFSDEATFVMF